MNVSRSTAAVLLSTTLGVAVGVACASGMSAHQSFFLLVKLIGMSARRQLRVHAPGCLCVGLDETAVVSVVSAAQQALTRLLAIDIQVGDAILCPPGVVHEGGCVAIDTTFFFGTVLRGRTPGRGRLLNPMTGWASFVRVSRQGFTGRARFRHEPEEDDDAVDP